MDNENNKLERAIGNLEGKLDGVNQTLLRLANAFDNLEKGRLSTLEINFAKAQVELADRARSTALYSSAVVSLIVTIVGAILVYKFTGK